MRSTGFVFLVTGLIMASIALGAFLYGSWFRIKAEEVTGTVIEVALQHYSDGNAYCPVIRYRTRKGQSFTHYSNICSWPAAYEQGQQVRLYVDPADPERVQLDSFFSKWFIVSLLGFMGAVFSLVGGSLLWPEYLYGRWMRA